MVELDAVFLDLTRDTDSDAWSGGDPVHGGETLLQVVGKFAAASYPTDYHSEIVDLRSFQHWTHTKLLRDGVLEAELSKFNGTHRFARMSDLTVRPNESGRVEHAPYYLYKDWAQNDIYIIGDIHGSLHALCKVLNDMHGDGAFDEDGKLKSDKGVVFLGDLLDRSPFTLEVAYLVFRMLNENENCVLTKGNHESNRSLWAYPNGTQYEMEGEYGDAWGSLWLRLAEACLRPPSSLILKTKLGKLQLNHGSFEDIPEEQAFTFDAFCEGISPIDSSLADPILKSFGPVTNSPLNWGDVATELPLDEKPSSRYPKSSDQIKAYLKRYGLRLLVRGHQDIASLTLVFHNGHHPNMDLYSRNPRDPSAPYDAYSLRYALQARGELQEVERRDDRIKTMTTLMSSWSGTEPIADTHPVCVVTSCCPFSKPNALFASSASYLRIVGRGARDFRVSSRLQWKRRKLSSACETGVGEVFFLRFL